MLSLEVALSAVGEQRWPPQRIVGARVVLEKHRMERAEEMFACVEQDRDRLGRWLPWVQHALTLNDEQDYIRHTHKGWDDATLFDFSILRQDTGAYCGNVGVHHLRWEHGGAELGYWVSGEHEGQGLVADAVRTVQAALFDLGIRRIEIRCDPGNERSQAIPKRLGYTFEGCLRQNLRVGEEWRDTLVFSLLVGEIE